jgi:glycosyltransferase involved in cell wall biosynthesis
MRLCIYTKEWRSSGTGLIAQELAYALADKGCDVLFVAPRPEEERYAAAHAQLKHWPTMRAADGHQSRMVRAWASIGRYFKSALGLMAAAASGRTLIINIPDPLVLSAPLMALAKLIGGRMIYVVHDPLPHAWRLPQRLRGLERAVYAAPLALADRLVVLTPPARDALNAAFPGVANKVSIIEHGVFVRAAPTPAPGAGELLLFGTLRANKGVREAIEGVVGARAAGAGVRLRIAGAPHGEDVGYWAECADLAQRHPDAVTLEIGFVENNRLDELIAQCDAFLMPYRNFNSQSGVAVLAASNARPVIATAEGGIAALLGEGMPGVEIAAPGDAAAVAAAILSFAGQDLNARRAAALAFRTQMLTTRSWAAIAAAYALLAAELAQPPG